MVELNVSKLFQVKNYEAGKGGNMLVFMIDKLAPVTITSPKGKDVDVQVLICTANVKDPAALDKIEELVDCETPCNKVILVSKKFKRLSNKVQRALLEIENEKYHATVARGIDTNIDQQIYGEIAAIEKFGKIVAFRAINKADRVRKSNEKKASRGLHRQYKKDCKQLEKLEKAGITDNDFFDDEEFKEVDTEEIPAPAASSVPENDAASEPNPKAAKFHKKNSGQAPTPAPAQ